MRSAWTYGTPGVERIIFQGICGQFKPHSGIPFFTLTYDGGLYHLDGSFNEKAFAILEKRYACEDWDGEKIISRALMKRFLEKETYQATRASHAPWLYQKRGMQNHEETFNLFFDKLISRYKINSFTQNKEGYVTLRNLKLWYVSGQTILNDIESGRLPAKQSF